jgi:hypothetical protein
MADMAQEGPKKVEVGNYKDIIEGLRSKTNELVSQSGVSGEQKELFERRTFNALTRTFLDGAGVGSGGNWNLNSKNGVNVLELLEALKINGELDPETVHGYEEKLGFDVRGRTL